MTEISQSPAALEAPGGLPFYPSTNAEVVAYAREALRGTPLIAVAKCESSLMQWEEDGVTVRWGRAVAEDRGFLQINARFHRADAAKLGFDLEDPVGNVQYGLVLYRKYGLAPWLASKDCWSKAIDE